MRRKLIILIAVSLFLTIGLSSLAFAREMTADEYLMERNRMRSGAMTNAEMIRNCPMHGGMMKSMMEKSMIAASDGGVIVLAGCKLIKYDKDLNFVKEVEIKIDTEAMQKKMMEMMKNCPMMKDAVPAAKSAEKKVE